MTPTATETETPAERVTREVADDPVAASVADLMTAIKQLTYERGVLILTARRTGSMDTDRVKARLAKIEYKLTQYASLVDAKRSMDGKR